MVFTVSGGNVKANLASGTATRLDWAHFSSVNASLPAFTFDETLSLFAEGNVTIDLFGLVVGSAHFELTKRGISLDLAGGPVAAQLMAFALTDVDASIGDPAGPHFTVADGSLALAMVSLDTPTPSASDDRDWTAVAGNLTVSFEGVDGLELTVSNLDVKVNTASGTVDPDGAGPAAGETAEALDWTADISLDNDTVFGETDDDLVVAGIAVGFTQSLVRASGEASVDIFGFVTGKVAFSFERLTVDVDADADGDFSPADAILPDARGPPDLAGATLTTIGLVILSDDANPANGEEGLFIGAPGGIGLKVSGGTLVRRRDHAGGWIDGRHAQLARPEEHDRRRDPRGHRRPDREGVEPHDRDQPRQRHLHRRAVRHPGRAGRAGLDGGGRQRRRRNGRRRHRRGPDDRRHGQPHVRVRVGAVLGVRRHRPGPVRLRRGQRALRADEGHGHGRATARAWSSTTRRC